MIPSKIDCLIVGTGLTNSIVAAACSRVGKSVLHIDKNNYYGNEWASFTFQQLIDWIKTKWPDDISLQDVNEELSNKSRMFCIDLCPRLLFSNGEMVDLLVKSNVSRYHEFKNNIRVLSMVDNEIHVMPCRRNDVFTSPLLSDLIDKRRLMKFVEMCVKFDPEEDSLEKSEINESAKKPIEEFLVEKGLKHPLKEYIINSIAMVNPTDTTEQACRNIKKFMMATERFGKSPFLFPLYGCGEFPQSFCRLSAVFGGVYCLNTQLEYVKPIYKELDISDSSATASKIFDGLTVRFVNHEQEVKTKAVVIEYEDSINLNSTNQSRLEEKVSRAILITKKSILPDNDNLLSFLRIPSSNIASNIVYVLEFNSSVMVCPPDYNLIYIWTTSSSGSAEQDLKQIVDVIFKDDSDEIQWKFYYQQLIGPTEGLAQYDTVTDVHVTSPPRNDIDYSHSISEAERIFRLLCPDEEFLPRAPDPDEIVT